MMTGDGRNSGSSDGSDMSCDERSLMGSCDGSDGGDVA